MTQQLGIAIVGLGGAVGTTIAAGLELLRIGKIDSTGLPLWNAEKSGLVDYKNISVAGWDIFSNDLASSAVSHGVLTESQIAELAAGFQTIKPWLAISNANFVANLEGDNIVSSANLRSLIDTVQSNLAEMKAKCENVVVINLASTEKLAADTQSFQSIEEFERAVDRNSPEISPAMLYAYAAISAGIPYGNFTPSLAADTPALIELAEKNNVAVAGKDGKTGQTFIKSVLAPALKSRALRIDGWFSTNILGNRDGIVLSDEESLASKVKTKSSLLDDILGYAVEDHIVDIRYYRPRRDNKEAWDNIDFTGFLGQPMQLKINFLCRDSILAAPLAIEIARCLDLAKRRGQGGIQEQLSVFFKLPMTRRAVPVHAFHDQEMLLLDWLAGK